MLDPRLSKLDSYIKNPYILLGIVLRKSRYIRYYIIIIKVAFKKVRCFIKEV